MPRTRRPPSKRSGSSSVMKNSDHPTTRSLSPGWEGGGGPRREEVSWDPGYPPGPAQWLHGHTNTAALSRHYMECAAWSLWADSQMRSQHVGIDWQNPATVAAFAALQANMEEIAVASGLPRSQGKDAALAAVLASQPPSKDTALLSALTSTLGSREAAAVMAVASSLAECKAPTVGANPQLPRAHVKAGVGSLGGMGAGEAFLQGLTENMPLPQQEPFPPFPVDPLCSQSRRLPVSGSALDPEAVCSNAAGSVAAFLNGTTRTTSTTTASSPRSSSPVATPLAQIPLPPRVQPPPPPPQHKPDIPTFLDARHLEHELRINLRGHSINPKVHVDLEGPVGSLAGLKSPLASPAGKSETASATSKKGLAAPPGLSPGLERPMLAVSRGEGDGNVLGADGMGMGLRVELDSANLSEFAPGIFIGPTDVALRRCTRAEWRIEAIRSKLQNSMGRPLVSPPFNAPGLPNLRLMVLPDPREAVKNARNRERKNVYTTMVKKGPLNGSLQLKADCLDKTQTVLKFYLTVGAVRRGPFEFDFAECAIHGCDDFQLDWLKQVESCGTLRVGVEILNDQQPDAPPKKKVEAPPADAKASEANSPKPTGAPSPPLDPASWLNAPPSPVGAAATIGGFGLKHQ
mmetsp:Transcript_71468/g.149384  ORF Transcript_71468/g.149384 Transcript_71468/m.149384 type:complete len:632 (+) Transcript_71468:550-2445(+)